MPTHRDPRIGSDYDYSFVESIPLPIPSQKGLKIQARSAVVYNPALPSRDEVRKENYSRRLQQTLQQGFSSVNFKPYKGIGDPFYLDQKKLILHALGQWQEGQELSSSNRPKSDDEQQKLLEQQKNMKPKAAAKFRLRRTRKDLHTLNKGVLHAKEIIRNVSLGHGLFFLLKKEKMVKMSNHQREMRQKREKQMSEWQPPKSSSSSDSDTDEDVMTQVNLTTSGSPSPQPSTSSPGGRSHSSHSRKHVQLGRPYTPHTTISAELQQDALDKHSLFRQLCALYWLLEAMSMELGSMPPITTSWNLKHFTCNKGVDTKDREKLENKWTDFVRLKANLQSSREPAPFKRNSSFLRASPSTLLSTPSGSQSQLFRTPSTSVLHPMSTTIPEHSEVGAMPEVFPAVSDTDASDPGYFGGSDRETMDQDQSSGQPEEETLVQRSSRLSVTHLPMGQKRGSRLIPEFTRTARKSVDIRKATEKLRTWSDEDSWIERRMEDGEWKDSRSSLRAERNIRPKSSPAVIKFQMECTSNETHDMPMRMRQEFVEISEEQAIVMHDTLESIERERLRKMQNKFVHMPTRQSNFYSAIKVMRSKSAQDDVRKMKNRRRSSIHKQWYVDLENNIGTDAQKDWYVKTILDKLKEKYGMHNRWQCSQGEIQSGNQSAFKFLRVLATLRVWEICSPDVSAAVDFCREKIIEMPIYEFDAWFASKFPEVAQEGALPPGLNGQGGGHNVNSQKKKPVSSMSSRKKSTQ